MGLMAAYAALATGIVAVAQPGAASLDKLYHIDRKTGKVASVEGSLVESPGGIVVNVNGKEKSRHAPGDIVRIEYGDLAGLTADDKAGLFALETEKDADKAARGFAGLAKKATGERVKRGFEWRELQALARAADGKDEAGFKTAATALAPRVASFARGQAKSWEAVPAAKLAARLSADLGDADRAAEVLKQTANVAGLPADLKAELKIAAAATLLRSKNPKSGAADVAGLLKDKDVPVAGTLREKLTILDLWVKGDAVKVQGAIDAARDPAARALGFNARGELFLAAKQPREAMWEFLNVDVVYDQDKDEVACALRRLVEIFEAGGERDRADTYREKLRKLR
jgi:hypothetical protein